MSNYSASSFNPKDDNNSWQKTFRLIPKNSIVLDVGCSSGTFGTRLIKEKNCTVDGIEIDEEDLQAAAKVLRNTYNINIETDPIDITDTYDIVFMGDVIEHLARPIPALKKIRDLLKPNGRLVFSMPNITHMSVRLMILKGEVKYGRTGLLDETHLHFYNAEEIYRVLNAAGFQIDVFDYTINDLPEYVLESELKKIGLDMKPKFLELSRSINGAAYQFIGTAKPGSVKKQALPESSPLNIVDRYHQRLKKDYEKSVAAVIADRDRNIEERDKLIIQYENVLNRVELRLPLKVSKEIRRLKSKLHGSQK